jgi:hypothetical protein
MTEWFEEAAPADLDELLDMPMHESGATRFELMVGEMIEQSDPVLGAQLYDGTLGYSRERDPDDPGIVVAILFERESGALVSQTRVAWNSFFHSWAEQEHHVRELGRVLRPGGTGYLAVPNRWGPLEPHFRLPGLSWLPSAGLQSRYVRAAHRGERYDCRLLSRAEVRSLFAAAGLETHERTLDAMHVMDELEEPSRAFRTMLLAPDPVLRVGLVMVPTLVFTFRVPRERL